MAYTEQNWQTGDVITAEKLNNMENGIGDSVSAEEVGGVSNPAFELVLTYDNSTDSITADKTYSDLMAMLYEGVIDNYSLVKVNSNVGDEFPPYLTVRHTVSEEFIFEPRASAISWSPQYHFEITDTDPPILTIDKVGYFELHVSQNNEWTIIDTPYWSCELTQHSRS